MLLPQSSKIVVAAAKKIKVGYSSLSVADVSRRRPKGAMAPPEGGNSN